MSVLPEYPQKPTVHRNNPTTINVKGNRTHCEVDVLAGQRNATKGNAGT